MAEAKKIMNEINNSVSPIFKNQIFAYSTKILAVLYSVFLIDNLPNDLLKLFNNNLIKLLIVLLIALVAVHDPVLSILLTVCFVLTVAQANKLQVNEIGEEGYQSLHGAPLMPENGENLDYAAVPEQINVDDDHNLMASNFPDQEQNEEVEQETVEQETVEQEQDNIEEFYNSGEVDVQSNEVQQNGDVKTWENQFSAQGNEEGISGFNGGSEFAKF
jgi:hypothetical protein